MDVLLTDKTREKPYQASNKPRILVAPLDWGLGHATRCIPVIRELIEQEAQVWLAGEGPQEQLLKLNSPNFLFYPSRGIE